LKKSKSKKPDQKAPRIPREKTRSGAPDSKPRASARSSNPAPARKHKKKRVIPANGEAARGTDEAPSSELDPRASAQSLALDEDDSLLEEAPELGLGSRLVPPHIGWSDPLDSMPPVASPRGDVAEQIRALEARLDGLIRTGASTRVSEEHDEEPSAPVMSLVVEERGPAAAPADDIAARPYFAQQWGRQGLRNRSEEVDDFGLDPVYESRFRPIAEFLYRRYFRIKTDGMSQIPADGRCILVANHSGTLPLDGLMLRTALRLEHPAARELRWLAEDFLFYLPFAGVFMNRVGAVRACQENAERLLGKESLVAVFPEGVQGIRKLWSERYQLQRFGRGGYIRLALRMQAPIIPCAIVGAEETNPLLYRLEYVASLMGLPYIPVTPTFPLLGPLGLMPAPSRWTIKFGEPVSLDGYGPQAAEDHVLVGRLSERVRSSIQAMLDNGVRERKSVWFG
jgi:1-acyl-sn-glycerol-3-phosphate acyltransferase